MYSEFYVSGMAHTPSVDPLGRIIWIDTEVSWDLIFLFSFRIVCLIETSARIQLTGLDPEKDLILEVACIITEANLEEVGGRVNLVINQPDDVLQSMGEWCQDTHRKVSVLLFIDLNSIKFGY